MFDEEYIALKLIIVISIIACLASVGFVTHSIINKAVITCESELDSQEESETDIDATAVVCTLLGCGSVVVLIALCGWHKRKIAETNLAILQTSIEKL